VATNPDRSTSIDARLTALERRVDRLRSSEHFETFGQWVEATEAETMQKIQRALGRKPPVTG
jgi:hypothetical protein